MDTLASFQYLHDRLPGWISNTNHLATNVSTKREEFAAEYKRALRNVRPKKSRSQSTASLRSTDDQSLVRSQHQAKDPQSDDALPRLSEISPLEPANRYLFANQRRAKRRQSSSMRSKADASHPSLAQRQVIIYYDSDIQHAFEHLVKEIAAARNNLRKRKQSQTLERAFQLPSLRSGTCRQALGDPALSCLVRSDPSTGIAKKSDMPTKDGPHDKDAAITGATTGLESAQALCETAAHQFLRNGDCIVELDQMKVHFESVLQIATIQVELLKQEAATTAVTISDYAEMDNKDEVAKVVVGKLQVMDVATVISTETAEIEVDSESGDDDEELVLDMSKFRTARSQGLRA